MSALTPTGDDPLTFKAIEAWLYQVPYWSHVLGFHLLKSQDDQTVVSTKLIGEHVYMFETPVRDIRKRFRQIMDVYDTLSKRERDLVWLRYWTCPQPTPEQIARQLNISSGLYSSLRNNIVYTFQTGLKL